MRDDESRVFFLEGPSRQRRAEYIHGQEAQEQIEPARFVEYFLRGGRSVMGFRQSGSDQDKCKTADQNNGES